MKPLLKASDGGAQAGVQSLLDGRAARSPVAAAALVEAAPAPQDIRIAELEARIAVLDMEAGKARKESSRREAEAYERGVAEGAKLAASREDERRSLLADALLAAQENLSSRLARLDILALEMAQTALARIFGDETLYSGMVAATLRHHLSELQHTMAIRARVSPSDFADRAALDDLAAQHPGVDLAGDPTLGPGECRLELRLGRVDAGIGSQWMRLSALMATLAQEGVEA